MTSLILLSRVHGSRLIAAGFALLLGAAGASGCVSPPPPPTCDKALSCPTDQPCLATTTNAGAPQFDLRIAEIAVRSPATLTYGASNLGATLDQLVLSPPAGCRLFTGLEALSWLLRFDLAQKTLTTGGAAMTNAPAGPFTFLDATVTQGGLDYHVMPSTFGLTENADGSLATTAPQDLAIPAFFGSTDPTILPLRGVSLTGIVVSPSHDCIGGLDPALSDPQRGCAPATPHEFFTHGGHLAAYLSLEETDHLEMRVFGVTLCAVLAGVPVQPLLSMDPIIHCPRTGGVIDYRGDWCSTIDGPATAACADAVHVTADFAASAVPIQG